MKKANRNIMHNENGAKSLGNEQTTLVQGEHASRRTSRWYFSRRAVGIAGGVAVLAGIALSLLFTPQARAEMDATVMEMQLGSPPFANPSEIPYRAAEKRLRGVVQLSADRYLIPNVGAGNMRQFRGWDAASPTPTPLASASPPQVRPGPTLRARLGDQVQIAFVNQIDDTKFDYTFVTDSPPGISDFGCDKAGQRDPATGKVMPYPADDRFPNCFHGSSTANIHFHGTHASPDGLGDNVLVQVLPLTKQPATQESWTSIFDKLFDSGNIPQAWGGMPANYKQYQEDLIKQYDKDEADKALRKKLPPPPSLWDANQKRIDAGQWPQYLMGGFPNFFGIPDYDKVDGAFNSGGNGFEAGQAPGTHWYHAHKHGATSLHILNGLAGAFVIESSHEGGYDHVIRKFYGWGATYGNHEKILVFQQYDSIQNLERGGAGPNSKQVYVNGDLTPTITMAPGEVQLWRFVNATEGNNAGIIQNTVFQTPGFTFKQTAQDGVQFSPDNYKNQPFLNAFAPNGMVPNGLKLSGGNRADLLVQAPPTASATPIPFNSGGKILFYVKVTGSPATTPAGVFPTTWAEMPKFLADLSKPGPDDAINQNSPVKFQWEDGRVSFGLAAKPRPFAPNFMINGKQFGQTGEVVDQCMPEKGLQDWILENYTSIAHPFHIHINPFQVIRIDTPTARDTYNVYAPPTNYLWQDVIAIPPAVITQNKTKQITSVTPGRIRIRQTYLDFTGTYVLHCHILAHEDRGMMQLVRVVPAADYPKKCQDSIPAHH
jgi:FtsP/CotA-like multicopper oxidase with cupredoxin domain